MIALDMPASITAWVAQALMISAGLAVSMTSLRPSLQEQARVLSVAPVRNGVLTFVTT